MRLTSPSSNRNKIRQAKHSILLIHGGVGITATAKLHGTMDRPTANLHLSVRYSFLLAGDLKGSKNCITLFPRSDHPMRRCPSSSSTARTINQRLPLQGSFGRARGTTTAQTPRGKGRLLNGKGRERERGRKRQCPRTMKRQSDSRVISHYKSVRRRPAPHPTLPLSLKVTNGWAEEEPTSSAEFSQAALQAPIAFCQPEVGRKIFFTIARVKQDLDFEPFFLQNPNPAPP